MSSGVAPVVALDVPSGIDPDTGVGAGAHVRAAATMTLALPKTGLDVEAVGELWVADIGIPASVLERAGAGRPPVELFAQGYTVRLATSSHPLSPDGQAPL